MVGFAVTEFAGAMPNRDIRLLPENAAALAVNMRPASGALEPVRVPRFIIALQPTTRAVYRIPLGALQDLSSGVNWYMQFADPDTDVVKNPAVNDSFERYFWASPSTGLRQATKAQILAGLNGGAGYGTGVQRPTTPVTLDTLGATQTDGNGVPVLPKTTRSYIVTFISAYGEEGAPSPAAEATGYADQIWRLRDIPQPVIVAGQTDITVVRVYRTVTAASGSTVFNRVVDLPLGQLIYQDTRSDLDVSGDLQLDSENADPPPPMDGLALMPNGVMVGFKGQNLYFSEDFKPWSWPVAFTLTVQHPIVGLAVYGNTCVVCTTGNPCMVTGNTGAAMSLATYDTAMPCLSRQSIVTAPEGVYWATTDGLALYTPSGVQIVTESLIGRDRWVEQYSPTTLEGVLAYGAYTGIRTTSGGVGFTFPGGGSLVEYDQLSATVDRCRVGIDHWSNRPWLIRDGALYEWLPHDTERTTYQWRSKEFQTPVPVNMGAVVAYFDTDVDPTVTVSIFAGRTLVWSQAVQSGEIRRLPAGFKSDVWQIGLTGRAKVHKAQVGQTVADLRRV